jgi:hypothetical protein
LIAKTAPAAHRLAFGLKTYDQLSETVRGILFDGAARLATAKLFGLKLSKWSPTDPIDSLINELQAHGPMSLGGEYGYAYYSNPKPRDFKTVRFVDINGKTQERKTYYWPSSIPRLDDSSMVSHCVLIVGAEIVPPTNPADKPQELVYYIDPNDPSDPANPDSQRILVMSLNRLRSSIKDVYGFALQVSPFGHAYYNPNFYPNTSSSSATVNLSNLSISDASRGSSSSSSSSSTDLSSSKK